jgi:hypothetical protein
MASERFKAWVKARGIETLAAECQVGKSTVYAWIKGTIVPSDRHRLSILALAKRKLKLADIVDGY